MLKFIQTVLVSIFLLGAGSPPPTSDELLPEAADAPPSLVPMFLSWTPAPEYDEASGEGPETTAEREARWAMAAEEADRASGMGITLFHPRDNQALVAVIWKYESALEYHVHGRGEKSPLGPQDGGDAVCFGQIHQNGMSAKEHRELAGRDRMSTRRCAEATLAILNYHSEVHCKLRRDVPAHRRWRAPLELSEVTVLMSAYAQGNSCKELPGISKRVHSFEKWRDLL